MDLYNCIFFAWAVLNTVYDTEVKTECSFVFSFLTATGSSLHRETVSQYSMPNTKSVAIPSKNRLTGKGLARKKRTQTDITDKHAHATHPICSTYVTNPSGKTRPNARICRLHLSKLQTGKIFTRQKTRQPIVHFA